MGSTQPHEYKWGATWNKVSVSGLEIQEYGSRIRCADMQYPLSVKAGTNFADKRWSVDIVRSWTKATEFFVLFSCFIGIMGNVAS
jgi:hypothetical protein